MNICIYGASCSDIDREYFEAARELGALIAENGQGKKYAAVRLFNIRLDPRREC